ncbi:MAG: cell division protein FtsA [Candidatus Nomurabacteria bacterium]|jgi:cell division protein FtsA|nr:cell division protein FtsA [Candidatus Nomurabacteria bacterium]
MQDEARHSVGIDIGTDTVRVAIGLTKGKNPLAVIGHGEAKNSGMRKGVIINIDRTAEAIDRALGAAEKMSGYHAANATVSLNGSHISGFSSHGVIAVTGREVGADDVHRAEDAAAVVQLGENREIIDITPRSYSLGDQENIKDPIGMTGVRLEVDAYIITALTPHIANLRKALELTELPKNTMVLAGIAAAKAVLTDQLRENGVALLDIGGSTTNLAVFEEGELLHTAVLPVGGNNITNDLAIGLRTELDIAERVKREYAVAMPNLRKNAGYIRIKSDDKTCMFDTRLVDEIVEARLQEIFELANLELKSIKRLAKLPGGVVLTGGGAHLTGIAECARETMRLSARVLSPPKFDGMGDKLAHPQWATALGLMMIDADDSLMTFQKNPPKKGGFWSFGRARK